MTANKTNFLNRLGVYGYDSVEPIILAALVSGDPLLLIGRHGTGKTFLLNSLSEALGLEHRHYNASLISFDDLVGFPYPEENGSGIRFIETPATVWNAESVLVDELNRCKPEHQNRFFSLVHERRLQGIRLDKLRYRWAAMNPPDEDFEYIGTEPLDPALADRFAFIVPVVDWENLNDAEQLAVANPSGEGDIRPDNGELRAFLMDARSRFERLIKAIPPQIPAYASAVVSAFAAGELRLSPRRSRQLARNLLAASVVSSLPTERLFKLVLKMSLPQSAAGETVSIATIEAAHSIAWDMTYLTGNDKWLHEFLLSKSLSERAHKLICECPDKETGSVAISQLIASDDPNRVNAFAIAVAPLLLEWNGGPVGSEGLHDICRVMRDTLHLDETVEWRDPSRNPYRPSAAGYALGYYDKEVPGFTDALQQLGNDSSKEYKLSRQLLEATVAKSKIVPDNWKSLQNEFQTCLNTVAELKRKLSDQYVEAFSA